MAVALVLIATTAAQAQMGGRGRRQHDQQQQTSTQSALPPGPVVIPEIWPRLDEGAVLCKSRDDLVRYQRLAGTADNAISGATACRVIQKQMGVQILDHDGPSRTQVVATDDTKESGWTNAYLPSQPPAGTRNPVAAK